MDRTKRQMLYEGPGGDEPEPEGLDEVRIGYFGPSDAAHVEGGSFWQGAVRAIEESTGKAATRPALPSGGEVER